MKVLHVSQPQDAGVARCVIQLATYQDAAGLDVSVACPPTGDLAEELTAASIRIHSWPATRSPGRSVPREVLRLKAVIERERPELVHLHASKAMLAGRLSLRGAIPTVVQPQSWSFEALEGPLARAAKLWERFAARRYTDLAICVSTVEAERARREEIETGIAIVPNGVDLTEFPLADADARADARRALSLDTNRPLAVCIGRLSVQKGQDVLLACWPDVLRRCPEAQLILVGEGPLRSEVERLAAGLGDSVRLVGWQHPRAWYHAANVVVLPSRWEGMALVGLEAAASGRSVVVTDVSGAAESLPDGYEGITPLGDGAALATRVAERLGNLAGADAEGLTAARFVRANRDVGTTVRRITETYESVLASRVATSRSH